MRVCASIHSGVSNMDAEVNGKVSKIWMTRLFCEREAEIEFFIDKTITAPLLLYFKILYNIGYFVL